MKRIAKFYIVCVLLLNFSSIAAAIEIKGAVVGTSGLNVTVKFTGKNIPVSGDLMDISFSIPGGDSLSVGTWKVTSVSGNLVSASVVEHTGTPAKGHQAVINSPNPAKRKIVKKKKTVQKKNKVTKKPLPSNLAPEVRKVIAMMQNDDSVTKRNGAKTAYKKFGNNDVVLEVAAEELEKWHTSKTKDRYHPDALSWLCNVLGASKDIQYADLLKTVYRKCPHKKVRKYAKKNLRKLR